MAKKKQYSYEPLELSGRPRKGYVIIDDTLFYFKHGRMDESWDICGKTINDKIKSAREVADLPNSATIYVDTNNNFDTDTIYDCGRLITTIEYACELDCDDDDEESEGWEEIAEYYSDL